jgi:4-amino-4-deoxy-L-arabinose transferase-like glycosyltransferase
MSQKVKIILLVSIIFIGSLLRLWHLGSVPISPDWDEVALAYNAHAIAQTGKDEYGTPLPIILRSYNDYKPGVYAYLAIPFVETLGLTTFAVRLPAALFGIIAIIAVYFLVKELFIKQKNGDYIALLAVFFFAISPWHIQLSRAAFESSVGLTFNILVALFFIKGLKNNIFLIIAAFLAALNLSVYQSERVFTPLLVLALVVIFRKEFFASSRKYIFAAVIAGIIALLPAVMFLATNPNSLERVKGTSIFGGHPELIQKNINRLAEDKAHNDLLGTLLDNRRVTYGIDIAGSYISHFDPKWLFLSGDLNRHHAPKMGLLYIFLLPFILFGMYRLLFDDFTIKTKYLIFTWFLIAAIPASITVDVPHAVRALNFLPTYEIFAAIGLLTILSLFKRKRSLNYISYAVLIVLFTFNVAYYLNQYFVQQNYAYAYEWQYGYEQAVPAVEQLKGGYNKILVSNKQPLDQSYMFFLFYLKYPPVDYQKVVDANAGGTHRFDKYEFRVFDWQKESKAEGELLVGSPNDFPSKVVTKKIIPYPNGNPAIFIVDPKDNHNL